MDKLDLVIRDGLIVDGSGAPPLHGEIGVDEGKIVEVSKGSTLQGDIQIDASGLVVAPGFVDIHTHSDFSLLQNPKAESYIRQGVTTSILGACGRSCAPINESKKDLLIKDIIGYDPQVPLTWRSFADYLGEFEKRGISQNIAAFVAHNAVRIAVMGYDERAASKNELEEMKSLVGASMSAGAIGLSTGLAYPPGSNADTDEVIELAKVAANYGGIYFSHLRGTDGDFLRGAREALEIGEKARLPVHMAHFCGFFGNFEETQRGLSLIRDARNRGLDVTCDLYPYLAGANPLMAFFPPSIFNRTQSTLRSEFQDSNLRSECAKEIHNSELGAFWFNKPETANRIILFDLYAASNQPLKGKSLAEVARLKGMQVVEATLSVLAEEGENMFNTGIICKWMEERDNFAVFREPFHMVGSDGMALAPYGQLASFKFHPRAYGAFPRVLRKYVRENSILTLEGAIQKMTSMPAKRAGLLDRGLLKKGMWADLTIFNYDEIRDTSTYERPNTYPQGIEYVIVNGELVIESGEHTGKLPGRVLRHGASTRS